MFRGSAEFSEGTALPEEAIDSSSDFGVRFQRGCHVRFHSRIDHQTAMTAPVFFFGERSYAEYIRGDRVNVTHKKLLIESAQN